MAEVIPIEAALHAHLTGGVLAGPGMGYSEVYRTSLPKLGERQGEFGTGS